MGEHYAWLRRFASQSAAHSSSTVQAIAWKQDRVKGSREDGAACKKGGISIVISGRLPRFLGASAPLTALAALAWPMPAGADRQGTEVAQLTVEQSLIVRVPRRIPAKPLKWKAKKGPKCVEMNAIAGAAVVADDAIDLVLKGGQRLRARFSSNCRYVRRDFRTPGSPASRSLPPAGSRSSVSHRAGGSVHDRRPSGLAVQRYRSTAQLTFTGALSVACQARSKSANTNRASSMISSALS